MFGYVVIDKPNILIKDYQTYRCYYCGLCKSIGKRTGQCMRMTLNYDIVLLALLGYNYEDKEPIFKKGRCPVHPLKKVEYVDNSETLERISDVNTILGYYKLVDDVIDEKKHRVIKTLVKGYYNKAKKRLPSFAESTERGYEKLREKEKANCDANTLAEAFGEILMHAADAVTDKADADFRRLLFYIGKWIYVIDAIDDLKEDKEKHKFNPFLRDNQSSFDMVNEKAKAEARVIIYDAIDNATKAYNAMKITISEGPLSNIVYLGLKSRAEKILEGSNGKCRKIRL